MNRQRVLVWLRVAAIIVTVPLAFFLLQARFRNLETVVDISALRLIGVTGVPLVRGPFALVRPSHGGTFWVYLSPSCSSLASIATLGCVAAALPRRITGGKGRFAAFLAAGAAVFVGNLLRIDISIGAGLLAGRSSLVLFHDWAGSIFGFAYTLGGFILMLWLLLPKHEPMRAALSSSPSAPTTASAAPA